MDRKNRAKKSTHEMKLKRTTTKNYNEVVFDNTAKNQAHAIVF